jgi:hypothetical protein
MALAAKIPLSPGKPRQGTKKTRRGKARKKPPIKKPPLRAR